MMNFSVAPESRSRATAMRRFPIRETNLIVSQHTDNVSDAAVTVVV